MQVSVDIEIAQPKNVVWAAITDIANCQAMISSILDIQIVEQPNEGLVGLKWREKRQMFGKEAVETMWITDCVENEFYMTRAESHGSVYISKLSLREVADGTQLTMSFSAQAQSFPVKIIAACMGFFIKGSMKKALLKDLEDIKSFLEK